MDYGVVAVQKQFIGSMHYEVYTRDFGTQTGTYICTLDNYHQDVDAIDYSTSEQPAEHKSHNLIELDNGQFALYPNNRMRIYDNSITPEIPKNPDFFGGGLIVPWSWHCLGSVPGTTELFFIIFFWYF